MALSEQIQELIQRYPNTAFSYRPAEDEEIEAAEQALSVRFPESYKAFLREFGAVTFDCFEVYGVIDEGDDDYPSIVFVTKEARMEFKLPQDLLPVVEFEDCYFALDLSAAADGDAPGVIWVKETAAKDQFREPFTTGFERTVERLIEEVGVVLPEDLEEE